MLYDVPGWPALGRDLELFARSRGVPFGIIYNGDYDDRADRAWLGHAQKRFEHYGAAAAARTRPPVARRRREAPLRSR